ncbi:hypothetical protein BH11MYX1_BH11MYX1_18810 [soil metagenome]
MFEKQNRGRWLALALGIGGAATVGVLVARRAKRAIAHIGPVTATVTINKRPLEVYEFFRDFSRLPVFMDYLESVEVTGERSSKWTAKLPVVGTLTWEADITEDQPGKLIAWQSRPGSSVQTRGVVRFDKTPGREMTEVRVAMQLGLAGKRPSSALARLLATPEVKGDMRRFKQVMETGEVLRSDASAHAKPYPAQPAADAKPAPPIFIPRAPVAIKGAMGVAHSKPTIDKKLDAHEEIV